MPKDIPPGNSTSQNNPNWGVSGHASPTSLQDATTHHTPSVTSSTSCIPAPSAGFFAERSRNCAVATSVAQVTNSGISSETAHSVAAVLGSNDASQNFDASIHGEDCSHLTTEGFNKLSEDLAFIQENDEHADIVASMQPVDESVVDKIFESVEDSAVTAQSETLNSEPQKEIHKHGQPACYHEAVMGLQPDHLYHWDIFYLKYMGGLNGEHIHEASYTNANHFEEVCSLGMVPSKSLSFVVDLLAGVQNGLKENGHPPCSLVYTDSPQTEQAFHEAITPSLMQNVKHVTLYTDLPNSHLQTLSYSNSQKTLWS
ncbi:hypothetical protein BDP27DRAFT_1413031 [Rhodocollybia butyracea]|uniref:Uncharacterized protein n=1 Tax=Rhodocollybia butyracea TaxID=206335 RepID=A0A9P5QA08_9AGAR|nr:hypothetical protein BDP27DRAFT_1413031 [Rhodocollybia butyracea]